MTRPSSPLQNSLLPSLLPSMPVSELCPRSSHCNAHQEPDTRIQPWLTGVVNPRASSQNTLISLPWHGAPEACRGGCSTAISHPDISCPICYRSCEILFLINTISFRVTTAIFRVGVLYSAIIITLSVSVTPSSIHSPPSRLLGKMY